MSVIALPPGFCPNSFALRSSVNQRSYASPYGGSEQVLDLLNDRWLVSMTMPPGKTADLAKHEAFIAALRGMTNTVLLYHFGRKVPLGSMRGTPLTNGAFAGADSMVIGTPAGDTLKAGDMIGFDGLLVMVAEDTVADGLGAMPVKFVNRLRRTVGAGLPVLWDRPTAPFRLVSTSSVQYVPGYAQGASLDFVEAVA